MVVKKTSAILGVPGEMIIPLNTDHHMICKYRSRRDGNYQAFLCVLRKLIVDATRRPFRSKHGSGRTRLAVESERYHAKDFRPLPTALPGSCEWILSDPSFSSWVHAQESRPRALWLCGPPGSGKSVLSAFVAQYIVSMRASCIFCFFSAPLALGASLSPDVLLKSLSHQLSAQLPELKQVPTPLTHQQIGFDCSSWYMFWRILIGSLLSIKLNVKTYLIVDDMDKFHDPESFLAALEEHSAVDLHLRLMVASEISQPFRLSNRLEGRGCPQILDLRLLDGVQSDLRLVVTEKVENIHGLDDLKPHIIAHILSISDGNFLCANLLYKEIKNCRRRERLQRILDQSLPGITPYYELMEMELVSRWTIDDQDDAQALMSWILYSFVPLTIEQLHHGMQYLGVEFIDLQFTITRVCGRFVTVDDKSQVRLLHPTARRFILDLQSVLSVEAKSAHHSIFVSCLSCLNALAITGSGGKGQFGMFQEYATEFWFRHLENCEINGTESALSFLVAFFKGQGIISWISLVSYYQELQYLIAAALSINRFIAQVRNHVVNSGDIKFLERCSVDLCMIVERFSKPLLSNPEVIVELVPLFCPFNSFIKPLARYSNVSMDGFPFLEWDNYLAAFTINHGCRGTGITCAENKFAITTSTQEGLILVYNSQKMNSNCELIHGERVMTVHFSRSGNELATYGPTKTTIWNIPTKRPSQTFSNTPNTTVLAIAFAHDDCAIFAFSDDYILRKMVLDGTYHDWESIDLGARREPANHWLNPSCATFDQQKNLLAVGFRGDPIEVWDLQSFVCIARLGGSSCPQKDVIQLSWCSHPNRIIVRQENGSLTILDFLRHEPTATCNDSVSTMSCSATSEILVTGDMTGTIKVRRMSDLTLLYHARSTKSSIVALSIAPSSGKIYGLQSTKCTIWEPSLLAKMTSDKRTQGSPLSLEYLLDGPEPNQDYSFVTALATCIRSASYCAGYANGQISVVLHDGAKLSLDLPTRVPIEHLLWSPDEQYLAIADIGARLFIVSLNYKSHQFNELASFKLQSRVEQLLFQRASQALLVMTKDKMVTWEIGTRSIKESHHSLGGYSRWINHPIKDDLMLGVGTANIQICQWCDHGTISNNSLNNSISDLTFGLELLDYVRTEPSSTTLHPSLAICQIKRVLTSPDTSMLLLVTNRQTEESISGSQFLQIPVNDLNDTIARSNGVISPFPLIESLSDMISMPLGFLPWNSSQEAVKKVRGSRLVFLSKENWICSTCIDSSNEKRLVQRHIFLPDDWLAAVNVELIQIRLNGIYIPRSENIVIIQNAFDAWY